MDTNFRDSLSRHTEEVEAILSAFLPEEKGLQKTVIEAMNYSFLAGGKRLRPMLMLETYRLFGGEETAASEGGTGQNPARPAIHAFMAAIEMIHTYSLIHDDLPAMDDDDWRRGRKTTHIVFGEAMAILAGDGLLNLAYETMAEAAVSAKEKDRVIKALAVLAKKAGIYGMVGGQTADVEQEGVGRGNGVARAPRGASATRTAHGNGVARAPRGASATRTANACDSLPKSEIWTNHHAHGNGEQPDAHTLDFIHRHKTSALIEAAMEAGAILAGADADACEKVEQAAGDIGLAFQIRDDILDVVGDEKTLGKPVGSDEKNAHVTYVTMYGLEQAKRDVEEISARAMDNLQSLGLKNPFLTDLIHALVTRDY